MNCRPQAAAIAADLVEVEYEPLPVVAGPREARSDGAPVVTLSTHLDTVPPWVPPRLEGDRLFGRGACDAKGIAAAMMAALIAGVLLAVLLRSLARLLADTTGLAIGRALASDSSPRPCSVPVAPPLRERRSSTAAAPSPHRADRLGERAGPVVQFNSSP